MTNRFIPLLTLTILCLCSALQAQIPHYTKEYTQTLNQTESKDYQMSVNFGSPVQRISGYSFNVDTTVDMLITSSNLCQKCQDDGSVIRYNQAASTTAKNITKEPETYYLPGKLEIQGIKVRDTVCVLSDVPCQSNVTFFAVTDYSDKTTLDIFGLGISKGGQAPSYITALWHEKLIDTRSVFLHLNPGSSVNGTDSDQPSSLIEFGRHRIDAEDKGYIDGKFHNHRYALQNDTLLDRTLMVLNLTSASVSGDPFVENTKAVIASNQQRLFVFGGSMQD